MARTPLAWDQEQLFTSGDEYFAALLAAIDKAQISVELETYIFEKGILAERLIKKLVTASQRGVKVRLIVDGWGSPQFVYDYWPRLQANAVRVRFFRVIPWILKRLPGDPQSITQRFLRRFRLINRGLHRKFCLIDGQELWVGSFNVSDVHLHESKGPLAWKDVGLRVQGKELRYARRAFHRAYRGWTALNWPAKSPRLLLLNDSFLHKRRTRLEYVERLKKAQKRIWISTPYFVPLGHIYRLLARRAKEGLDVRITIPRENDVWIMKWMSIPLLKGLSAKGAKIFVYEPRFAHQKILIVDDWVCIGSTNLNHRSFLHDLEMDVVVSHEANRQIVIQDYEADQKLSAVFDHIDWAILPAWKRYLSAIFNLLKYWS